MCRRIVAGIIDVHKRAVHNRDRLEKVRQHLTQVVRVLERRDGRQDNIDLDKQLVARVVGAQVLDLANGGGEPHGEVEEQVTFVLVGGEAGEVADMVRRRLAPGGDDNEGEEETAGCVEPPDSAVEADCCG